MKELIINHFLNYEFVYIFLFCSIIFLLISIFIKQKIIRKISMFFFSICFILFVFEFVLSLFMVKIDRSGDFNCFDKIDFNNIRKIEEISYFNDKNIQITTRKEDIKAVDLNGIIYDVVYSLFENGLRCTKCNFNVPQTYIFFGCSFTFGAGLNDDETLPYYFSKLYNFEKNIINCGVRGLSSNTTINILNNYETLLSLINEKSNIEHCFYSLIYDHIYRNFRIDPPSDMKNYIMKKWYISTNIGRIKNIFARSYMFRKVLVPIIDEIFKQYYENYMIQSLEEINKIIEEKYNSKLTIIVWPDGYDESFYRKLNETKLDLIFLPNCFESENKKYRIKNDDHPTAKANEEIAKILYNHINEKDKTN